MSASGSGGLPLGRGGVHLPWTHTHPWTHTRPPRSTSGRYASYWNALFVSINLIFILLCSYEVRWLRKVISAMAVNQMLSFCSAKIIAYAIFLVYALQYTVNTEAVFIALSLLNTIRLTVSHFMPLAVRFGSECAITFQRMQVIDKYKLDESRHLC